MRTRRLTRRTMLLVAAALLGLAACNDDGVYNNPGPGGGTGGAADIDVTNSTPATGNTNISGSGVTVTTSTFTGTGTGGFDNGVNYTRVQVDATSNAYLRQVLVYFVTATGVAKAVTYSWGVGNVNENVVYCPAAGCTGVSVNTTTKEISFSNTALDNHGPGGPTTDFATLSLGMVQYPLRSAILPAQAA